MKIEPSSVAEVELIGPGTAEFREALEFLLGGEPDEALHAALPYSVIVRNNASRAIALLGIRFNMIGEQGKQYSVVHYADTLRNPEKADLTPGAMRFVCAEPLYTGIVLGRKPALREAEQRARMNLSNLAKAREIRASLDCVAFDDGHFAGPDSLGAFERFAAEREAEIAFLGEILNSNGNIQTLLAHAMEIPARKALAKRLQAELHGGGVPEMMARARSHRPRIALSR